MNESSGQLFITVSQKNKFLLDGLVELYGGSIYPMVKQGCYTLNITKREDILNLVEYFKKRPARSAKKQRLHLIPKYYLLKDLNAHKALPGSCLTKS
jgi:hypothetical protein